MKEPEWVKIASNHAIISRDGLLAWIGVNSHEIKLLISSQGFPMPRIGSVNRRSESKKITITSTCRWRVGDVRAWLIGPEKLAAALEEKVGTQKHLHAWSK